MRYVLIVFADIALRIPYIFATMLTEIIPYPQSSGGLTIPLTARVCMPYQTPINPPIGSQREQLMLDVGGVEMELCNIPHLILPADALLMLVLSRAHPSFEDNLLNLAKVMPPHSLVPLHAEIR